MLILKLTPRPNPHTPRNAGMCWARRLGIYLKKKKKKTHSRLAIIFSHDWIYTEPPEKRKKKSLLRSFIFQWQCSDCNGPDYIFRDGLAEEEPGRCRCSLFKITERWYGANHSRTVTQNSAETLLAPCLSSESQNYTQAALPTSPTATQLPSQPPSAQTKAVLSQVLGCSQDTITHYYTFY